MMDLTTVRRAKAALPQMSFEEWLAEFAACCAMGAANAWDLEKARISLPLDREWIEASDARVVSARVMPVWAEGAD